MQSLLSFFRRLTLVPQGTTVVIAAFLPIVAIVSMFPAVPSIIEHFAGNPDARWQVPMMVSAPGLTIALTAPFAGYFVDRFGRRPLLLAATLLYAVFGALPFLLDDLTLTFYSRLALGLTEAAILTIVNTLIGDYWDDRGRRDWLTIQGIAGPFLASGVILLAGPATAIRWNGIFLIYLVALPIFLSMLRYVYEPARKQPAAAQAVPATPFPWAPVALIGSVTLLASALYYVFIINGGLAFKEVGVNDPASLSELSTIPSLFVMAGAVLFRLLGGRSNALQLGAFFLVLGGGLAGIGASPNYKWMIAALVVQQTGAGMTVPSLIAWAQTKLPFEHRGRGMGVWTGCFFFGQFSSPWIVHQLNELFGTMQGAFLAAGLVGILAGVIALLLSRHLRNPVPHTEAVAS